MEDFNTLNNFTIYIKNPLITYDFSPKYKSEYYNLKLPTRGRDQGLERLCLYCFLELKTLYSVAFTDLSIKCHKYQQIHFILTFKTSYIDLD